MLVESKRNRSLVTSSRVPRERALLFYISFITTSLYLFDSEILSISLYIYLYNIIY